MFHAVIGIYDDCFAWLQLFQKRYIAVVDLLTSMSCSYPFQVSLQSKMQQSSWTICMRVGAMIAIVFVHNLLRRHPSCSILLHKPLPAGAASTATSASHRNGNAEPHAAGSPQAAEKLHDGNRESEL